MTKDEFLAWIAVWSSDWDDEQRAGTPGFGDETTLGDWIGSIAAYAALEESNALPRQKRGVQ